VRRLTAVAAMLVLMAMLPVRMARPDAAGELRVGLLRLPVSLDPASIAVGPGRIVFRQVFEGLVRIGESGDLEPGLAARWSVSRDGLVWTFRLRPDARFHDGSPVTPRLVVQSLARHLTPLPPDQPLARTPPRAWAQVFRGPAAVVREVRVEEPGAVQIHLRDPFSPLLAALAHPGLAIVLPQNDAGVPFLGTGPYRVVERTPGRLTLVAVPSPAPPRVPRLVFHEVGDDATGIGGLRPGGPLDVYFPESPPAWAGVGLQVLSAPAWRVGGLALRSGEGLFASRTLRQAVVAALDPELIHPALGAWADPWSTLVPPGAWGVRETPRPPHDPARARRLVTEARAAGATLTLLVPESLSGPDLPRLAEAIRISLAVAGLTVRVRTEPGDVYERALRHGEAESALGETVVEIDDPHFTLRPLLATDAATRATATNVAFYRNPAVDGVLLRASQLAFRPERLRLYQRLQAQLAEEAPYVPLYARRQWVLARPTVRGLRLELDGEHRLDRVWVQGAVEASPIAPPPVPIPAPAPAGVPR
jgi:ABC-type transport system substrate-binding protein